MGLGFVARHKRKTLLATLLLIFRGRAKYLTISLVVVATSLPFVMSTETMGRVFDIPPVAAAFRALGLGGVVSYLSPRYSGEFVKTVMDKAAADSARGSYWNRLMSVVKPVAPADVSSLAMVQGGDVYIESAKDANKRPREVIEKEKNKGDVVNLVPGDPGVYGDTMAQNLMDRYSGSDAAPYLNRSLISSPGDIPNRQEEIYSSVMSDLEGRIPVPGRMQKMPAKMTGQASGFSWKNSRYKKKSSSVLKTIGSKKPMFQLSETYAAGKSAYDSPYSAPEYQASYVGATYDGNDINKDILQTGPGAPIAPSGFVAPLKGAGPDGGVKVEEMSGVPGNPTTTDSAPELTGSAKQAEALILASVLMSLVGAVLVTVGLALMCNPFTAAAGFAKWCAGIAMCIVALMMALAAIALGVAMMAGFGQMAMGAIYVFAGIFAVIAAILGMTGFGVAFVCVLAIAGVLALAAAALVGS